MGGMIMKKFDLEEYLADPSRKVITRDGKQVRIICTDADRKNPIVALVKEGDDKIFCYQPNGLLYDHNECNNDLFFETTKKEGYINIYRAINGRASFIFDTKEEAEKDCNYGKNEAFIKTIKISWEE